MSNQLFKVALVGCGVISENHLKALTENESVCIVALCDNKLERASKRAAEYNLDCKVYQDYEEMLDSEKLDAVHICTPHYLHAPMTLSALKHNVNVFLEKPTAVNEEELLEMIEAEKAGTAKVCICFQNRYNPSTILAKKLVEEDGCALSAFGALFWERNEEYYTKSDWRGRYATEGGGAMINQAIHTIDLLCEFLGRPIAVTATASNHKHKGIIEVEDTCEGLIEFEGGKQGNFFATTASIGSEYTMIRIRTPKRIISLMPPSVYINNHRIEDPSLVEDYVGKECYGNGHKYLIKKFYKALKGGTEMPVPLAHSQYALKILLGAYKSQDERVEI